MGVKLHTVAAAQGWVWVREGLALLRRNPLGFGLLFSLFIVASTLVSVVPVLGGLLVLAAVPLLSLAYVMGAKAALDGMPVTPDLFTQPWRDGGRQALPLLALCVGYAGAMSGVMVLCDALDGGRLATLMSAMDSATNPMQDPAVSAALQQDGLLGALALRMLLVGLVSVPFWHAPALVVWAGQGAAQALFSSTLALWHSRGAYAIFMAGWGLLTLGTALLASLVMVLAGAPVVATLGLMVAGLWLTAAFYASLYGGYRDNYGAPVGDPLA